MRKTLLLSLMAPLAIAPLTAHSAPKSGPVFVPWTELVIQADRNSDGGLTLEEIERFKDHGNMLGFHPFMTKYFKELDSDGNEQVTMHEIKRVTMKMGMSDAEVSTGFRRGFMWDPAPN